MSYPVHRLVLVLLIVTFRSKTYSLEILLLKREPISLKNHLNIIVDFDMHVNYSSVIFGPVISSFEKIY